MLFNSYEFILLFLPICLIAWWGLARFAELRLTLLVAASYLFYGWWNWHFTALLALSTLLDWAVGHAIERSTNRRYRLGFLLISVAGNLGMLAYFKYTGFLATAINDVLDALRFGTSIPVVQIILPVGISFYTFQTLTYSIDLYRGNVRTAKSLLHFAAYVSMFPQLIAGPIVRYSDVEDQLRDLPRRPNWDQCSRGIWFFVIGLSQKVLVADTIARTITPLLVDCSELSFIGAWLALVGYAGQLYFDFAGYSNMAVGLGHMMGLSFPMNFDSPYKSSNIQEFWRRWHMTLSSFLRDYLYIPLGGNRSGKLYSYRNLLIVMLLGGLWHGAGWTFLIWGAIHGCLLVGYAIYRDNVSYRLPRPMGVGLTFLCVLIGWLFFRSTDLAMASDWLAGLAGFHGIESDVGRSLLISSGGISIAMAIAFCWFAPNVWQYQPTNRWTTAVVMAGLLCLCILRFDAESPFLYFQF
ncbi:MAG: MBOAT family O-acyltransferase [Pirellulaceae bacterium]|nr:MBOAT family O-acyltransferase [Pirellulaceae bacterium]